MHYSKDEVERTACVSAFNQAHGILVRLSAYTGVAKRAIKALDGVIKKWGGGNTTGISRSFYTGTHQDAVENYTVTAPYQYF
jgi:hypothetical protein